MTKINDLRYDLLPCLSYSPVFACSDIFLFPNLELWLGGERFGSNEVIVTRKILVNFFYLQEDKKLENRWMNYRSSKEPMRKIKTFIVGKLGFHSKTHGPIGTQSFIH